MPLEEEIGEGTLDIEILEGIDVHLDGMVGGVEFLVIGIQVNQHTRRIDTLAAAVQGVLGVARLDERRKVLRRIPVGSTADAGLGDILMTEGVGTGVAHFQPFEELAVKGETAGKTLLAGILNDTLGVIVGEGGVVGRLFALSGQRERIVLRNGRAGNLFNPVRALQTQRVAVHRFGERRGGPDTLMIRVAAEISIVVAVHRKLGRIHNIQLGGQAGNTHIRLEGNVGLACIAGTLLGRDDDNAVRTAGTVDSRRGSIFQYGNGGDIVGVDIVEVADGIHHAVHDDKGLVGSRNGTSTTDTDGRGGTRSTVGGHKVGSGDTTLKGVVNGNGGRIFDISHLHIDDGTGQVGFLDRTITDDHDIFQHILVGREDDGQFGLIAHGHGLVGKTDVRNRQYVGRLRLNGEITVQVGDDTRGGIVANHHGRPNQRNIVVVEDRTGNGFLLRRSSQCHEKQHDARKCIS